MKPISLESLVASLCEQTGDNITSLAECMEDIDVSELFETGSVTVELGDATYEISLLIKQED